MKIITIVRSLHQKGAFHVVAGSFLTKFVSFFGSIFLVRVLSKSDYGILSYFENLLSYFIIFQGLGLAHGIQRYLILGSNMEEKKGCYIYALKHGTLYNIIIVAGCIAFNLFYPHPAVFRGNKTILAIMAFTIPFLFFQQAGLGAFRALFDYKRYALLSFCVTVALIVSRVTGAYWGGLTGTVSSRLFIEIIGGLICAIFVAKMHFYDTKASSIAEGTKRGMNRYSWQMMLTNGLWAIFMLNDLFLLGQLSGDQSIVADYKVAYVIPSNLSILVSAIGVFVAPYFTKHENDQNFVWVRKNYKFVLLVSAAIMGGAAFICYYLSNYLIVWLYGEAYRTAIPIMNILLLASFFNNGIRATTANALSAMGQQKYNLYISGIGIVIQLLVNCVCIPRYGALSVAWTSVFIHFVMGGFLLTVFWKKYYIHVKAL